MLLNYFKQKQSCRTSEALRTASGRYLENTISTIYLPTTKISQLLRPVKDKLEPLNAPGIYRIPCECGHVYIGMTKGTVAKRLVEHERYIRLQQAEKSAVAEHALSAGHRILFGEAKVKLVKFGSPFS